MARRTGHCLGCGQHCCTRVGVPISGRLIDAGKRGEPVYALPIADPDYQHWLALHGIDGSRLFFVPPDASYQLLGGRYPVALFPARCRHLTEDGGCGIYGQPDRPQICDSWPAYPWELEALTPAGQAACGYSFT